MKTGTAVFVPANLEQEDFRQLKSMLGDVMKSDFVCTIMYLNLYRSLLTEVMQDLTLHRKVQHSHLELALD